MLIGAPFKLALGAAAPTFREACLSANKVRIQIEFAIFTIKSQFYSGFLKIVCGSNQTSTRK